MSSSSHLLATTDPRAAGRPAGAAPAASTIHDPRVRRALRCGALAGPIYVLSAGIQIATRDGFDLRRHAVSLLSNGDLGWIQITTFVVTGALVIAGAVGLRCVAAARGTRSAVPTLAGLYGLALVGAGLLVADPALGFPVGTPTAPPTTLSWHGIGHLVSGAVGFFALAAACLVAARHARREGQPRYARASLATGVLLLTTFAGVASGAGAAVLNLAFSVAVAVTWAWVTGLHVRAARRTAAA